MAHDNGWKNTQSFENGRKWFNLSTHENTKWLLSVILSQRQNDKKEWSADGFKTVNRCLKYEYPRRCEMSINIVAEGPKVPGI